MAAVIEAIAKGEVTPAEGAQLSQLISSAVEVSTNAEMIARIEKLERGEVDQNPPEDEPDEPQTRNVPGQFPPTSAEKSRIRDGR